ncbi:MAG: gamma carbonic anhydrase family protein [Alphaproteobacteria bacterium]|nr:gamma carbonic anhydrase family protein [Alphaproteobacteria bacterium]
MPLYEFEGTSVSTPESGRFYVAPNACLMGNVILEDESSIWFGTVLRGDIEPIRIGKRSNVQDGCVLHTDAGFPLTIEEGCTIGHMVMLHGCTIGRRSLIGIGSIVLNGAKIGEECLIGANSLIAEGKQIPPRSLVMGSPGKIIRQLTDEDVAHFTQGADRYVKNGERFRAGLKPQPGS